MVGKKLSNLLCSDYWKMHMQVKKWKLDIFTHVPQAKFSPNSFSSPPQT